MAITFQERKAQAIAKFWSTLGDSENPALRVIRTTSLAVVKFVHDDCFLYASSLTFYSIVAIVPIIALALGLARGFGLDNFLLIELNQHFPGQQAAIELVLEFAQNLLNDAKGGVIAGVGFFLLGWSILKVLGHTERAFNRIWAIRRGRNIGRRFSDYLSLIILTPFALLLANSTALYLSGQVMLLSTEYTFIAEHLRFFRMLFSTVPTFLIAGLLGWIYYFMPNTTIRPNSAALGGIVCGILFTLIQALYLSFQIGAARYDAVYGSFVALPLLLLWVYLSWLIVLLGSEITYVHQNGMRQPWELSSLSLSHRMKMSLMLAITHLCIQRFEAEEKPMSAREIAQTLEIPLTYIKPLMNTLVHAELLFEMRRIDATKILYIPNKDIHTLTTRHVIHMIEGSSSLHDLSVKTRTFQKIAQYYSVYAPYLAHTAENKPLLDIEHPAKPN